MTKRAIEMIDLIKIDKGTWIVNSQMAIQNKGEPMKSKGMVLYMNRNTRTTNGYYYVNVIKCEDKGKHQDNEKDTLLKWSTIK